MWAIGARDADLAATIRIEGPGVDRQEPPARRALDVETAGDLLTTIGASVEVHESGAATIVNLRIPKVLSQTPPSHDACSVKVNAELGIQLCL